MPLRELPEDQRPRERLFRNGVHALSDYELLAIVLGAGTAGDHALALAERLLADGGLQGIRRRGPAALLHVRGIGRARAAQVAAALEIGRRAEAGSAPERLRLDDPAPAYRYLKQRLDSQVEQLIGLLLDRGLRVLGEVFLGQGGQAALAIRPADVLRPAVVAGASAILLAHNHPSGDPTPSEQDVGTTTALAQAAKSIGIQLVDHLVIGDNSFVSMRLMGYLGTE
jgi:DNA repair protein RadC